MNTELSYYIILFVYTLLWSCQMVVCHLTHSLIVLTDSYINIYRILDISVGIIHFKTQRHVANRDSKTNTDGGKPVSDHQPMPSLAGRLFDSTCTYNFKRLPLLGSFINGLFLAALLMSAAIEGIQTCFHSSHSLGHDAKSILLQNPRTYPLTLVGFAIVGLIMQYCSMKAHEMREEELCSESLLDIHNQGTRDEIIIRSSAGNADLDVTQLSRNDDTTLTQTSDRNSFRADQGQHRMDSTRRQHDLGAKLRCHSSFESIPLERDDDTKISLKSLKFTQNDHEPIKSISRDLEADARAPTSASSKSNPSESAHDGWTQSRFLVSPVALIVCALIIYQMCDELITEISDASLSVVVVTLLFASSYPPMKKAGKVLLQTAPDGVDLERLKKDLSASNSAIVGISNLKVWSLTARSNRVATCRLILDHQQVRTERQLGEILHEAKLVFLDQNIKCTAIEPALQSSPLASN